MTKIIPLYLLTLMVFLAVDAIWLGFIAKNFYRKYLSDLLTSNVNWVAALIFYLLFVVGVLIFVVLPAHEAGSLNMALLYGALFGLFTYATYDLTNFATLKGWPLQVVIVDILWGMFISVVTSVAGFLIADKLL